MRPFTPTAPASTLNGWNRIGHIDGLREIAIPFGAALSRLKYAFSTVCCEGVVMRWLLILLIASYLARKWLGITPLPTIREYEAALEQRGFGNAGL